MTAQGGLMANLGNPQETIAVLQRYGFNFQKKYGQNFLIDTHVPVSYTHLTLPTT